MQKSKNKYCLGHVSLEISLNFGVAMDTPLRFLLFLVQEICFEIFISHTHTHTNHFGVELLAFKSTHHQNIHIYIHKYTHQLCDICQTV